MFIKTMPNENEPIRRISVDEIDFHVPFFNPFNKLFTKAEQPYRFHYSYLKPNSRYDECRSDHEVCDGGELQVESKKIAELQGTQSDEEMKRPVNENQSAEVDAHQKSADQAASLNVVKRFGYAWIYLLKKCLINSGQCTAEFPCDRFCLPSSTNERKPRKKPEQDLVYCKE